MSKESENTKDKARAKSAVSDKSTRNKKNKGGQG